MALASAKLEVSGNGRSAVESIRSVCRKHEGLVLPAELLQPPARLAMLRGRGCAPVPCPGKQGLQPLSSQPDCLLAVYFVCPRIVCRGSCFLGPSHAAHTPPEGEGRGEGTAQVWRTQGR